jgi:GPH family glycoside/pentoside/hexuronide:cation symporter
MKKLSLRYKLIYAMGNLGIALITVMQTLFMVYFFFPPKDSGIPYLIPQGELILGLTLFGVIMGLGRMVDAVLDPVIANFSDRLKHPDGRRIPMMRWAMLPFTVCWIAVFFVPDSTGISVLNTLWLSVFMVLGVFFFTAYMIPFYSLMVEVAKTSDDKVDLGTISSAFWFAGFLVISFSPGLWPIVADILDVSTVWSVRITFAGLAVIGLACLAVPVLMIDERKFADPSVKSSQQNLLPSLGKVLRNRNFSVYLAANTSYTIASTIFESGLIYFITVLALKGAGLQGTLTTIIGALTLACYPLVAKLSKSRGKAWVLKVSLALFAMTFAAITFYGVGDLNVYWLFAAVIVLSPFAQASFGILPQVVTSDCAAWDQYKSGEDHAGMYIAANGFFRKIGGTVGMVLFTSFLLFGKDVGNDMGIRYATVFAAGMAVLGMLLMTRYDEREIMTYTEALGDKSQGEADSSD